MFEQLNKNPQPATGTSKSVEDIFSDVDAANKAKPATFQPKSSLAPGNLNAGEAESAKLLGMDKKYFMIGLIALAFLAVMGGGIWGMAKYNPFKGAKPAVAPENVAGPEEGGVSNIAAPENSEPAESTNPTAASLAPDADGDGLADEEEKQLGMNAASADSDGDGLFDREEVKVYGTDPLKPDTDGDGYTDGGEVAGGYNPKGTGKLYEIK